MQASGDAAKSLFEFSSNEWHKAQMEGSRYAIYRVFGAMTRDPKVVRIANPYLQFRQHKIGVCLSL